MFQPPGTQSEWGAMDRERKCVSINRNGVFSNSKKFFIELDWDLENILENASHRLEIRIAKRVFNADGDEIDDAMMIFDDDMLFLSHGDDFKPPPIEDQDDVADEDKADMEQDNIPPTISGYRVADLLGRGGFGVVRLGIHQITDDKVALKFIRKSDILTISAVERTMTEIQCLASLKHANIIILMQHLETPEHVLLIFELMEGGDLLSFLRGRGNTPIEMALSDDLARHVFQQMVSAISYAHNQHICHRDLKLENILLKGPNLDVIKVADFGLSDFYRPGVLQKSNCGTLSFLAPEGFRNTKNAGPPLDVWSLGVILYAMLCGKLPFDGETLTSGFTSTAPGVSGGNSNLANAVKANPAVAAILPKPDKGAAVTSPTISRSRTRSMVIRGKILKGSYRVDDHVGVEAKDIIRRMLKVDAKERISMPEIFNHVWHRIGANNASGEASIARSRSHSESGDTRSPRGSFTSRDKGGTVSSPMFVTASPNSSMLRKMGANSIANGNKANNTTVDTPADDCTKSKDIDTGNTVSTPNTLNTLQTLKGMPRSNGATDSKSDAHNNNGDSTNVIETSNTGIGESKRSSSTTPPTAATEVPVITGNNDTGHAIEQKEEALGDAANSGQQTARDSRSIELRDNMHTSRSASSSPISSKGRKLVSANSNDNDGSSASSILSRENEISTTDDLADGEGPQRLLKNKSMPLDTLSTMINEKSHQGILQSDSEVQSKFSQSSSSGNLISIAHNNITAMQGVERDIFSSESGKLIPLGRTQSNREKEKDLDESLDMTIGMSSSMKAIPTNSTATGGVAFGGFERKLAGIQLEANAANTIDNSGNTNSFSSGFGTSPTTSGGYFNANTRRASHGALTLGTTISAMNNSNNNNTNVQTKNGDDSLSTAIKDFDMSPRGQMP
jgi:serine/threonine protein kinase